MAFPILLDIIALLILLICAFRYARKGMLSSLLVFLGTLASIVLAVVLANKLSPAVFENFFQEGLERQTVQAIGENSLDNISGLARSVLSFLPGDLVDSLVEGLETSLDFSASDVAAQIVQEVIAPLVIPIISIIVFFVVFAVCRVLISLLSALLTGVNKVPLLGTVNRALGAIIGILIGVLYVYLLMCVVWAVDASYGIGILGQRYFSDSIVYQFLENWNIFAV